MADLKISQLTSATTPLAGTEVLPIVQSGSTVKVTVNNMLGTQSFTSPAVDSNGNVFLRATDTLGTGVGTQMMMGGKYNASAYVGFGGIAGRKENATSGNLAGYLSLLTCSSGGTIAERVRLDSTGNATINTGNLVIGTSGKGIDFSATAGTGTSELLADYEEGTWTPTGNGITYASASGTYTKIGRQVTVVAKVVFPATADTNRIQIAGLPFTTGSLDYTPEIFQGTATPITGLAYTGTTLIEFYNYADTPVLRNSAFSGLTLRAQLTYFV